MTSEQLMGVVAIFVPLLVGFIKQAKLPDLYNAIIAIVVYVAVGVLAVLVSGQAFTLDNIIPALTIFVGGGTVAYQLFWKNFEATTTAAKIGAGSGPTLP